MDLMIMTDDPAEAARLVIEAHNSQRTTQGSRLEKERM
jgi:hypothetical protein